MLKNKECPVPKILAPVDGSPYSMKGVEHAACLAAEFKDFMNKIAILRVINLALFEERLTGGIDPEEEAQRILEEAKAVFLEKGINEGLIVTKTNNR